MHWNIVIHRAPLAAVVAVALAASSDTAYEVYTLLFYVDNNNAFVHKDTIVSPLPL